MRPMAALLLVLACVAPAAAQSRPTTTTLTLPVGTPVALETVVPLSSRTSVKGDLVPLRVAENILSAGVVVIPRGTEAVGQIADARAKGAMGMSGRLLVRPLYLRASGSVVRLTGQVSEHASVTGGAVLGTVVLRMPAFTGRSAVVPAGTRFEGAIERSVTLPPR